MIFMHYQMQWQTVSGALPRASWAEQKYWTQPLQIMSIDAML
jgi:hypothetical protein